MRNNRITSGRILVATMIGSLAFAGAAAGCGSSSSTPAFCDDRSALESSINGLTIPTSSSEIGALQSQFTKIKGDATTLVASAKSDYPSQTSAISSSVDTLNSAIDSLPSNPTATQVVAVATDASAVVTAVHSFSDATESTCN